MEKGGRWRRVKGESALLAWHRSRLDQLYRSSQKSRRREGKEGGRRGERTKKGGNKREEEEVGTKRGLDTSTSKLRGWLRIRHKHFA